MGVASRRSKDPRRAASPWAVSFRGPDGKRKIRYCVTKDEAERLYGRWRTDVREGKYQNPSDVQTLGELCDRFAELRRAHARDGHVRSHVVEDELGCMELYLRPYFGHRKLVQLTQDDIENF